MLTNERVNGARRVRCLVKRLIMTPRTNSYGGIYSDSDFKSSFTGGCVKRGVALCVCGRGGGACAGGVSDGCGERAAGRNARAADRAVGNQKQTRQNESSGSRQSLRL